MYSVIHHESVLVITGQFSFHTKRTLPEKIQLPKETCHSNNNRMNHNAEIKTFQRSND